MTPAASTTARGAIRDIASRFVASRPAAAAVDALDRVLPRAPGRLSVLMYHRIGDAGGRDPALVSASAAEFDAQIRRLRERRPLVGLDEVLAALRGEHEVPAGAVLVTFDDACTDFATEAWPVLRHHDVPAVVFVPTDFPDHPDRAFWWDRVHAAVSAARGGPPLETPAGCLAVATDDDLDRARLTLRNWVWRTPHDEAMAGIDELARGLVDPEIRGNVLGWDDLRALQREGLALGAHSRSHPRLDRLPADRAVEEVLGSIADLERATGSVVAAFAYPGGGVTDELVRRLREAGLAIAFTTERGVADLRGGDPLRLPRINVGRRSSPAALSLQMLTLGAARRPGASGR